MRTTIPLDSDVDRLIGDAMWEKSISFEGASHTAGLGWTWWRWATY